MTEAQRDYLADLAAQKGVQLEDADDVSVAWASAKIEELKKLPDASFSEITKEEEQKVKSLMEKTKQELWRWNFQK